MKRRIKLIVTGDVERIALTDSLRRWFPERAANDPVEWLTPRKVSGTTSTPLGAPERGINSSMAKLARAMIAELWDGSDREGRPADLVLAVDDLELANQSQPARVVAQLRAAVDAEVLRRSLPDGEAADLRRRLQERGSFHLVAPMIEAYFFGERAALTRARVDPSVTPRLRRADVEDFEADDPDWAPTCAAENAAMAALGHAWWRHERHPKHYLVHLSPKQRPYAETTDGVAALSTLDWPHVPADTAASPFIRALFEDLAEWFGVDNPLGHGACAPETSPVHLKDRRGLLLRNL